MRASYLKVNKILGDEKKKMATPTSGLSLPKGVILAIVVMAAIGGTLSALSVALKTADLTQYGPYGTYLINFLEGSPVIVFSILVYNVWMYIRQHQLAAVNGVAEAYDWHKLVATITLFLGLITPIVSFLPQYAPIGATIITIGTAFVQELSKVLGGQDTTEPPSSGTASQMPTVPTVVTNATTTPIGTYQGWTIKIVNGFLQLYPPTNLMPLFGQMLGMGSVIGYPLTKDFIDMTKPYIDQCIAQANAPKPTPVIIPPPA